MEQINGGGGAGGVPSLRHRRLNDNVRRSSGIDLSWRICANGKETYCSSIPLNANAEYAGEMSTNVKSPELHDKPLGPEPATGTVPREVNDKITSLADRPSRGGLDTGTHALANPPRKVGLCRGSEIDPSWRICA